jgi:prepilin-type N-terminal cleavage/methylation domain-containing protein
MVTKPRQRRSFRTRAGFTLVELLIVVVIIGILAIIGMAKYDQVRERAYQAALQSDMQSLIKHQELHFLANQTYGTLAAMTQYQTTPGVHVVISYASVDGWSATTTHPGLSTFTCGIFVGAAPPGGGAPATVPETITCAN